MSSLELLSKSALLLSLLFNSAVAQDAQFAPFQDPSDPTRGRIEGLVLDENDQALANATVTATPVGRPRFGIVPQTQSDANGRFALAGLTPGQEYLNAFKEEAFYPRYLGPFWTVGQSCVAIHLPEGGDISGIVLKVSPAAPLEVRAIDVLTGLAVDSIGVRLERDGSPEKSISGTRTGNMWLVPTVAIRLRVDAVGFESAWYTGGNQDGHGSPLVLAPREVRTVIVPLLPSLKQP